MGNEVAGTVDEKDANVLNIKGEGDTVTRYVKEADLLTVKEGRDTLQRKAEAAEAAKGTKSPETIAAEATAETARNAALPAEAKVVKAVLEERDLVDDDVYALDRHTKSRDGVPNTQKLDLAPHGMV